MKSRLFAVLRVTISLVLIGLFFYMGKDTIRQGMGAIRGMSALILVSSCAIFLLSTLLIALRLKVLFDAQGLFLRYPEVLHLTLIGYFFNNFLPTAVGGDMVKMYYTYKKTNEKIMSFTCIFMDRLIGLFSLFILAGVSLLFCHKLIEDKLIIWLTVAILALMGVVGALLFNKRFASIFSPILRLKILSGIREKIKEVYTAINSYKEKKREIAKSIIISITAQAMAISVIYFFSQGLGAPVSIKIVYLFMPIIAVISMLPSIGGLGIRENAVYLLFGPYAGYENAFSLSLLWLFMFLMLGAVGGISYVFRRERGGI